MYTDELLKIKYYRDRIAKQLTSQGNYPDDAIIRKQLSTIDSKLSILQFVDVEENTQFDTKKYNEDIRRLYQDLLILYKLTYQHAMVTYKQIKEYAELHLTELERLAKRYQYKTRFETNSTSLGKTIFFQTSSFPMEVENSVATLSLGSVKVKQGSRIACLFEGDEISDENVIFSLGDYNCSPYSYNKDFLVIPGKPTFNSYYYEIPSDLQSNSFVALTPDDFTLKQNNIYIVYAGENQVSTIINGYRTLLTKQENSPISAPSQRGRIEFYVVGGTYITFDFNQQPLSQNFAGYKLEHLESHHKIVLEYDAGFIFNYVTDGIVYAARNNGFIENGVLYYPDTIDATTFFIEEYGESNEEILELIVYINSLNTASLPKINMIALKELTTVEEIQNDLI